MAYPPSDPANNKTDATETVTDHPAHHNALASAVIDIVDELGASPKGGAADLTARLTALDTTVAGKEATGTAAAAVSTHAADTTDVHGIADTSVLATDAEVASAVSDHAGAADPHAGYQKESEKGQANGYASLDGDGLVPSAQLPPSGASGATITTQAADYTLVLGDANTEVEGTKATAQTITVPPNADVAFPVGTIINVRQMGAGQITVAAGAGVTLRAPRGAKTGVQYATVSLVKRATNEWVVGGDATT